jgi:hypothetical protein
VTGSQAAFGAFAVKIVKADRMAGWHLIEENLRAGDRYCRVTEHHNIMMHDDAPGRHQWQYRQRIDQRPGMRMLCINEAEIQRPLDPICHIDAVGRDMKADLDRWMRRFRVDQISHRFGRIGIIMSEYIKGIDAPAAGLLHQAGEEAGGQAGGDADFRGPPRLFAFDQCREEGCIVAIDRTGRPIVVEPIDERFRQAVWLAGGHLYIPPIHLAQDALTRCATVPPAPIYHPGERCGRKTKGDVESDLRAARVAHPHGADIAARADRADALAAGVKLSAGRKRHARARLAPGA